MLISNSLVPAKNAPKKVMIKNLEKGVKTKYSKFGKFLLITFNEPFLKSASTNLKSALLPTLGRNDPPHTDEKKISNKEGLRDRKFQGFRVSVLAIAKQ
jgi:hypothetical protein